MTIYLEVPFSDKELAKSLGARWDRDLKCWTAPEGSELSKMYKWFPVKEKILAAKPVQNTPQPKPVMVKPTPEEAWKSLPPRTEDPAMIRKLIGREIFKTKRFFCGMCDSNAGGDWCYKGESFALEPSTFVGCVCFPTNTIGDLTSERVGILRPSEWRILAASLES